MGRTGERTFAAVAVALCLALAAPAAKAQDHALIARVEATLSSGIEASSAHEAIVALGDRGELALRAVFEREGAAVYVRLRALGVLSRFATEQTAAYFVRLIQLAQRPDASLGALHPARSSLVLRRALEGLLPVAELLQPAPQLDDLSFCLTHEDAHVRRAAADLLGKLELNGVDTVLTKRLADERSLMVRGRLQRALTGRPAAPHRAR